MPRSTTYHTVMCPCGVAFEITKSKLGRAKYCSNTCKYTYRVRPSGLKYTIVKENPTSFKPGHISFSGEDHPNWLGELVGYKELHRWVRTIKQLSGVCSKCGSQGYTEWSNISFEYKRVPEDWQELCRKCHRDYDLDGRGAATAIFGTRGVQEGFGGRL